LRLLEVQRTPGRVRAGEVVFEREFRSSYGYFDLRIVDLTGDGIEEFVLITGEGHGAQAREETLEVWRRSEKSLASILSVPVSGYWGVGRTWWYAPQFVDRNRDGIIDLELVLGIDPTSAPGEDVSGIPEEAFPLYVYDRKTGKMKLYRWPKRR
jgi:hypothetical protein